MVPAARGDCDGAQMPLTRDPTRAEILPTVGLGARSLDDLLECARPAEVDRCFIGNAGVRLVQQLARAVARGERGQLPFDRQPLGRDAEAVAEADDLTWVVAVVGRDRGLSRRTNCQNPSERRYAKCSAALSPGRKTVSPRGVRLSSTSAIDSGHSVMASAAADGGAGVLRRFRRRRCRRFPVAPVSR